MIFIVNDYQTARKHIFSKGIKIRNITFIGANKYKDCFLELSEDLNNKNIDNIMLIGSAEIQKNAIPNLYKWKWTLPELDYFNYFETYSVNKLIVRNELFSQYLKDLNNTLMKIEKEYSVNLRELYKFVRRLLPIVIPSKESRLTKQLENLLIYFKKDGRDILETVFFEIDEYDYEDIWNNILEKFIALIDLKKEHFLKFRKIQELKEIDYLIVSKEYLGIWKEETNKNTVRNVISFTDFEQLEDTNKIIVFLGFFGYYHLKSMLFKPNKIYILLYPQEEELYKKCFNKFKRDVYKELRNPDREAISEISFKETEREEDVSELIKRLFEKDEEIEIDLDYSVDASTNISYEVTFENDDVSKILDENKSVLLKTTCTERFEKVKNLKIGDTVRIYDNSSKEELYEVALEFDTEGEFSDIEKYSNLWKSELKNYSLKFKSVEKTYKHLKRKGLSIKNETLKNWINVNSNIKFPQKNRDLLILKKSINSDLLNNNYNAIIKNKRAFNGIMIALGRDLSEEISIFIKENKRGPILKNFTDKQIQQFINRNAKERIIKSIEVVDNE